MALRNMFHNLEPRDMARVSNDNFRDIDNRFRTNVVRGTNGQPRLQTGRIGENQYGQIIYDSDGNPIIVQTDTAYTGDKNNLSIEGFLGYSGGYGTLKHDSTGKARILIGIDPDGQMNIHISKSGEDVITDVFS